MENIFVSVVSSLGVKRLPNKALKLTGLGHREFIQMILGELHQIS